MKAILTVLLTLGVPKWAIVLLIGAGLSWAGPRVVAQIENDKARRIIKAARLAPEPDRAAADAKALGLAGSDTKVLFMLAREALELGRRDLADQALARLRSQGVPERALVELDDLRHGPLPVLAAEAAMRVERLMEREQWDDARLLVARSVRRWPQDAELAALKLRCDETGALA